MHKITLQQARLNAKLSLKEAAERVGISVKTLRRWEENCGRSNSFHFFELLKLYGVHINHIHIVRAGKTAESPTSGNTLMKILRSAAVVNEGMFTINLEQVLQEFKLLGMDIEDLEHHLENALNAALERQKSVPTTRNSENALA